MASPPPAAPPAARGALVPRERLYERLVRGAVPVIGVAAILNQKLRRGVDGRRGAGDRLRAWADSGRAAGRPLVWVHAPSLGEGLMAQAIVAALRRARADLQIVFTHFSPSAERLRGQIPADAFDYLPWDTRPALRPVVEALRPSALVFVRTDVWPVLSAEAARVGAVLALVNAALAPDSTRLRGPARALLRPAHGRLAAVGAVRPEDAARFPRLGVPRVRVRVTGDARFDQVRARVAALDRDAPLLRRLREPAIPVLVAGSTWPEDESRLLSAAADLVRGGRLRLVIAPHEPSAAHLEGLERRVAEHALSCARLDAVEQGRQPVPAVLLVDRVGVLADLYTLGALAYVGGGFGSAGLHSVVEPAALGIPVLFGPRVGGAGEAEALAAEGGGYVVADPEQLAGRLRLLLDDAALRVAAGNAAAAFVEARVGAAQANASLVLELLDR